MASRLSWLNTCKLSQLAAVATSTGINSSGTKAVVISRLRDELATGKLSSSPSSRHGAAKQEKIISIDMGIRNLAYCQLVLPKDRKPFQSALPVIEDWNRINIAKATEVQKSEASGEAIAARSVPIKEAFDPATYAQHAYNLVAYLIATAQPTQVLIERQRFRSMGGSAVQEWTLRVNMFEAMIYAVLGTFREKGLWDGEVHPIIPGKVSKFWLGESTAGERVSMKQSSKTKNLKIQLVERWLKERSHFTFGEDAVGMGRAYLRKRQGRKDVMSIKRDSENPAATEGKRAEIGKLDDLADCLLQGLAWVRWEENRTKILEGGLEALGKCRRI